MRALLFEYFVEIPYLLVLLGHRYLERCILRFERYKLRLERRILRLEAQDLLTKNGTKRKVFPSKESRF